MLQQLAGICGGRVRNKISQAMALQDALHFAGSSFCSLPALIRNRTAPFPAMHSYLCRACHSCQTRDQSDWVVASSSNDIVRVSYASIFFVSNGDKIQLIGKPRQNVLISCKFVSLPCNHHVHGGCRSRTEIQPFEDNQNRKYCYAAANGKNMVAAANAHPAHNGKKDVAELARVP